MRFDFLISSERSGSNLITKLIDNHSLYCGPSPIHLIRVFNPIIYKYGDLRDDEKWGKFIEDVYDFFYCKIGVWKTDFNKDDLLKVNPRNLSGIVHFIYSKEVNKNEKKDAFIKEVGTYNFFPFIQNSFNSKFIWLVRDPRDMALSWSKSPVHRGDIVRGANTWKQDQYLTLELYKKHSDQILLIKYEELIANQVESLQQICSFLKIEFEESMIQFHKNEISEQNALQTDSWKNLNKKIINNNSKKYLSALSKEQIQFIEFTCQKEMMFLGYDFEYPLIKNTAYETLKKELNALERNEKAEYKLISEREKAKRNKWYKKFLEIQQA